MSPVRLINEIYMYFVEKKTYGAWFMEIKIHRKWGLPVTKFGKHDLLKANRSFEEKWTEETERHHGELMRQYRVDVEARLEYCTWCIAGRNANTTIHDD